jgi:predicted PurR-regulated permease PerM
MRAGLAVGQFLMALTMGYYWLTARERMLELLLRMSPVRARARIELVWNDVETTLAAWMRGQVILVLAVGVASYAGLRLLGMEYALPLAVIAGLTEAIPIVGPILGAIPAVVLGFGHSVEMGLLVSLLYLVIQQVEGYFLVPRVMERAIGLHPLTVLVALIAGATLNGMVGALLAVPVVGAVQVVAKHLLIEPTVRSHEPVVDHGAVLFEPKDEEEPDEPKNGQAGEREAAVLRPNGS